MNFIADILLAAGAISCGLYCFILSRKLQNFSNSEDGIAPAVAALSAKVDELNKSVDTAKLTASESTKSLSDLTNRAENTAHRIELLIASLHDLDQVENASSAKGIQDSAEPIFSSRIRNS